MCYYDDMRKVKFLEEIKVEHEAKADFDPLKNVRLARATDPIKSQFTRFARLQEKHRKDFL